MTTLIKGQQAAARAGFDFARTIAPDMSSEVRSRLLRELAELSVDPAALDRDSEVDIWGFHNDA